MPILDCGPRNPVNGVMPIDVLAALGPTVLVDIGFDPNYNYAQPPANTAMQSQATQIPALVDTGASECCIDDALAQQIGLSVVDRQRVAGVGGTTEVNFYLGHLVIPALGFYQWGKFAGVHLQAGNQPHQALIGRNMLKGMILIYDGLVGTVRLVR